MYSHELRQISMAAKAMVDADKDQMSGAIYMMLSALLFQEAQKAKAEEDAKRSGAVG